jgi:hypothetical protein
MHQGWDYRLYKIYVWGGLVLIVAQILVSVLVFDALSLPQPQVALLLLGPMLLWFGGILLYWWWVFLFKGNNDMEDSVRAPGPGVPGIKSLRSWGNLHRAMAISGGNVEELLRDEKRAKRPILLWYGSINLLVVWIFGPIVLGSLGIIQADGASWGGIWLGGVFVWVALMLVGTPILLSWGSKGAEKAYLAPLGLAVTQTPQLEVDTIGLTNGGQRLIPAGPAIFEGERYGRLIHIETIGRHCLTVVQAMSPEFQVQSDNGKLNPTEGAPEVVVGALRRLRKAKRWRGIAVYGSPEGIAVQRHSRGTNMWLYDLWLAEYLLADVGSD